MPERLDRVIVATSRGKVEIPWASRDALLEHLRRLPSAASLARTFEAAPSSGSVTLSRFEEQALEEVVRAWFNEAGARNVPPGIADLRHALRDEDATGD